MDFDLGADVAAVRRDLRALIAEQIPEGFLGAFTNDPADLQITQDFCRTLAERGLLCVAWPEEWGGRGASPWVQTAVREEMWAWHEPRGAQYMGVNWVGPTIMRHGTAAQQHQHLPPIARGEVIWCQGFSEPDSGTDLASVQTAARRDGEGWFVSGQKIWTSYATMAQWCFLLTRTTKGEKKQQGLTIFLVPMDDPAIEVRPIANMIGPHHLNEVFFNDVWVTPADVLGTVDDGWAIVQEVLAFERVGIARYARCERLLGEAPAVLGNRWDDLPEELRARSGRVAHLVPSSPPLGLPGRGHTGVRPGAARRRGGLPHRRDPPRPAQRRGAGRDRRAGGTRDRVGAAVLTSGRGPLALRPGVHRGVGEH